MSISGQSSLLLLSDIHLNLDLATSDGPITYGQDSSLGLLDSVLISMRTEAPDAKAVLLCGDLTGHHVVSILV